MHVAGDYAYLADDWFGLRVIDVSEPSNPYEVGFCYTRYAAIGVHVAGGYAYVADSYSGLCILRYTGGLSGSISGYVKDKMTQEPIPKTLVVARQGDSKIRAITDKSGHYEILDLQIGEWQVICLKKGYKLGIKTVEVSAGEPNICDFSLESK
ncbi:carboxypeptidase regulatory-like domain-containing protein [bacterium]|nr:carboxypeptidase regulatory-like domain-containing protein [bacterium]